MIEKTVPVIEVFGPTVQGEGVLAGVPTYFVRYGLCDYRCVWCDSKYAVEPSTVKEHAERLTSAEVVDRVLALPSGPRWVTLSGGNPAMHNLTDTVALLQKVGYKVAVETQGSIWNYWLGRVDCLTVSPKPPSSGMVAKTDHDLPRFMEKANLAGRPRWADDALKIVVFDDADYDWAVETIEEYDGWPVYLSCGTDPVGAWGSEVVAAESHPYAVRKIGERYAWLCDKVAADHRLADVRVLPQLHVVAYGHARGV